MAECLHETEKLYFDDSHMREFDAVVTACEPEEGGYRVQLDRTAFFPEGGGQYADTGYLKEISRNEMMDASADRAPETPADGLQGITTDKGCFVRDVQELGDGIWHMTDGAFPVGTKVRGQIDWDRRFESMQQHTGEHIISGLVHGRFGYNNVGFHLGEDYCTMDFDGPLTKEELREIEYAANGIVYQNLEVENLYPSKEELKELEYRSKIEIEGQVRIVCIPGVDTCACCAPHVKRTGEIGNIKLVNMMNYKGGERIFMLCGYRALSDHAEKEKSAKAISALLCVKEPEIAEAVERLKEEEKELKAGIAGLQQKLLAFRAQEMDISGNPVTLFDSTLTGNAPREMMNLLLDRGAEICAVFAGTDADGYRYVIGSRSSDVRPLSKMLNEAFSGRGGGKPEMVQGSLAGKEAEIRRKLQGC